MKFFQEELENTKVMDEEEVKDSWNLGGDNVTITVRLRKRKKSDMLGIPRLGRNGNP